MYTYFHYIFLSYFHYIHHCSQYLDLSSKKNLDTNPGLSELFVEIIVTSTLPTLSKSLQTIEHSQNILKGPFSLK